MTSNQSARVILVVATCGMLLSSVSDAAPNPESRRDEAGVRAAEDHWNRAEFTGDEIYLGRFLDPRYLSVDTTGAADKAAIISGARKFAATSPLKPGVSIPTLPATSHITVEGDTAVVTHVSDTSRGVDVLYYAGGFWHALYSQHTPRPPRPDVQ